MQVVGSGEPADAEYVRKKLIEYNSTHSPQEVPQHYDEVNILLKDDNGNILGGVLAIVMWNFMHVDVIWVDESIRGKGHGSQLLAMVEQNAQDRGCVCVQLDTFSFQAPDFYRQRGYHLIGTLEYVPNKFSRHYLVKWLTGDAHPQPKVTEDEKTS